MNLEHVLNVDLESWQVDQVIVLDWYDGPRQGFCRLRWPQAEFLFKLLDERPTETDLDDRLFSIYELPEGSVASLLSVLAFLGPPVTPVWTPAWVSSNPEEIQRADEAVKIISEQAAEGGAVIRTSDFVRFTGCWRVQVRNEVSDWFAFLGVGDQAR